MRDGLPMGHITSLHGSSAPTLVDVWHGSREAPETLPSLVGDEHFTDRARRGPFRPPEAPANPGPVHFGTIDGLSIVGLDEALGGSESHREVIGTTAASFDYETYPLAVLDTPPIEPVQYIEWLHVLDQHTEWIRMSHGWTVRHLPGRVFIKSPSSYYSLYHPHNWNQCPSAVQEDIARWLVEFNESNMAHELVNGYVTMDEGWYPVGESGEWTFHWSDQIQELALLHTYTGLYCLYDSDNLDSMPPLPFETVNIAMGIYNRLHNRFVRDSRGREYVLTLSFDPPDVLCTPPPVDPDDGVLVEYMFRFRNSLDSVYNTESMVADADETDVDAIPVQRQSRWTLVDEDHASGE